jgi:hypothetical protein
MRKKTKTMQKTRVLRTISLIAILLFIIQSSPLSAQVTLNSRASELTITGRTHTQFNTTSVAGEKSSEFLLRRTRLTAEVTVNDLVSGKVQPDFGGGKISLKDAYLRLSFSPKFRMTSGQFKRAFDIFELTSSTQTLVIERGGDIRGVDSCMGPGTKSICSYSRFTENLGYSDRDIGVIFDGTLSSRDLHYSFAITNGAGANNKETTGTKSFSGRLEIPIAGRFSLSPNFSAHDYLNPVLSKDQHGLAWGADLEYGSYGSPGVHLKAGMIIGDNWKNMDIQGKPSSFRSFQTILAYKKSVSDNSLVELVEPLVRISWGDPDRDTSNDGGILSTFGFVTHFVGRNKIAVNLDTWNPTLPSEPTEFSLKIQSYLHF